MCLSPGRCTLRCFDESSLEAKFSGAMAVAAGPTAYFELVKAVLMARLSSSVAPKFGGLELELW